MKGSTGVLLFVDDKSRLQLNCYSLLAHCLTAFVGSCEFSTLIGSGIKLFITLVSMMVNLEATLCCEPKSTLPAH